MYMADQTCLFINTSATPTHRGAYQDFGRVDDNNALLSCSEQGLTRVLDLGGSFGGICIGLW